MAKSTGEEHHPQSPESWFDHNVNILGHAPAHAMANTYYAMAHSTGLMFQNAVSMQQCVNVAALATTYRGVETLLGVDAMVELDAALEVEEIECLEMLAATIAVLIAARKKTAKNASA